MPPQLTSLTFNTTTLNLSKGARRVTVTAHATDTAVGVASGVADIEIDFTQPDEGFGIDLNLVSGTPTDGTWKGSLALTRDGVWTVDELDVVDGQGNDQVYGRSGKRPASPTDLRLHSDWDSAVTVTGHRPAHPSHPTAKLGKLTGFRLTPKAVNTTHHAKTVKVTADFSGHRPDFVGLFLDDESDGIVFNSSSISKTGTARIPSADRAFARVASGKAAPAGFFFKQVILKRTKHDHWVGHVKIGRWLGHLVATPNVFAAFGSLGRPTFKTFDSDRLKALHFTHALKITSGVDKTKPRLTGLRVTPTSVDTTSGSQLVTVTARTTDTQSGVAFARAQLVAPHDRQARGSSLSVRMTRRGNVWTGQAKIRECVPSGNWRVSLDIVDRAENVARYSSQKLLAAGLPGQLSVTSQSGDSRPPSVKGGTASAAGHMITLDFSEGVKNVTDSSLTVFALAPDSARFQSTLPISGIVCSDGAGTVACSGSGGLVTSAVLTVPDVTLGHSYEVWANQNSVTSQLTDGAGNPLGWSEPGADVIGS